MEGKPGRDLAPFILGGLVLGVGAYVIYRARQTSASPAPSPVLAPMPVPVPTQSPAPTPSRSAVTSSSFADSGAAPTPAGHSYGLPEKEYTRGQKIALWKALADLSAGYDTKNELVNVMPKGVYGPAQTTVAAVNHADRYLLIGETEATLYAVPSAEIGNVQDPEYFFIFLRPGEVDSVADAARG